MRTCFFTTIVFALACSSCLNNNSETRTPSSTGGVVVDLEEGFTKDVSIVDIFSKVEIVELERSSEAMIAEQTILSKAFGDTSFYVLDRTDYLIREFDYHGKLLSISDKHGRGPGEIVMANDMIINEYTETLDVLDPRGLIYKYHLSDLSWAGTIDLSDRVLAVHFLAALSQKDYCFYSLSEAPVLFLMSDVEGSGISALDITVPTWLTMTPFCGGGSPFYRLGNDVRFTLKYNGNTYKIGDGALSPNFIWDLGKFSFSPDLVDSDKDYMYYRDLLNKTSRKYATAFNRVAESQRFLLQNFRFKGPSSWNLLIYDKNDGTVRLLKKTKEHVYVIVGVVRGDSMYALVDPDICDYFVNEEVLDEPSLTTYKQLSDDSNVVMLKYTFRDDE